MLEPLKVFIGYDPSETQACNVLAWSIFNRASKPVSITFLRLDQLRPVHQRDRHPLQSTEFSFTRFLVPYLSGYNGFSVFLDCDMLVLDDIHKIVEQTTDSYAPVSVVMHNHKPQSRTKMLGQTQTQYSKKNWSSVMLFNSSHFDCKRLTPEYVEIAEGLALHQFDWVECGRFGRLPFGWNHLVGYDDDTKPVEELSLIHWTEGGPWWEEYKDAPYSDVWRAELADMNKAYRRVKHEAA